MFTPDDQNTILFQLQSSWYLMIVAGQAAHIWVARTCTVSIFEHGLFGNMHVNMAVIIALALGCVVTYVPGISYIVQSGGPQSQLDILYASLMISGALWGWSEGRKWFTRSHPKDHWFNRIFAW